MKMQAYRFEILQGKEAYVVHTEAERIEEIDYLHLKIERDKEKLDEVLTCRIVVPGNAVYYRWTPKIHLIKGLNLDWFNNLYISNGFTGAPVEALVRNDDSNHVTIGLSDTLHTIEFRGGVLEETAEYAFEIKLKDVQELTIRMDFRQIPYYTVLQAMSKWWENLEGMQPMISPKNAFDAMYSTWYSYHQELKETALLEQCKLSKELHCKTILLDDGWQTDDNARGYAYCGDWEPAKGKIPDMKDFVKKVHQLGMKVMLWYSVPFIGEKSYNFNKFKNMLIDAEAEREWHVLDPRYKKVREHIIQLYENALKEWDLDGFKLDFIDEFVVTPFSGVDDEEGRDFTSFAEAADFLMKECILRLKQIKPDIMLEFRQTYNGPRMRTYGNIFRAVDCPLDSLDNHIRVTDVRLLANTSAVHSDMIMWSKEDTVENAALQVIQVLFSVPQISMRLEELSKEHDQMLKFYLHLWHENKEAFLQGDFEPRNLANAYSTILGYSDTSLVATYSTKELIDISKVYEKMLFINGSSDTWCLLNNKDKETHYIQKTYDCLGNCIAEQVVVMKNGISIYQVPKSGVIEFTR